MELLATDPVFENKHMTGMTVKEQRELVLKQLQKVASCGLFRFRDLVDEPLKWITFMETLYFHGANIATKAGVHFGLFGNTIVSLGSEKMIKDLSDKIQSLEVRGAFALTELGHGSNARDIETTAHYDSAKQEFILHSPAETSQKMWIGNLGMHGNHAAVFAQLYVDNRHQGVHVFLVRIRDEKGNPVPGVRLLDCGTKMGLNGIDNGRMWLDHVRIPRENLLDRYGGVGVDGKYASPIASPTQRFTTMISALVGGRLVVAQGALHMSKVGLAIATRYALSRKQFGPPKEPEIVLLDYLGHQRRLFPLIAKTYALQFAMNHVKDLYAKHVCFANIFFLCLILIFRVQNLKNCTYWHQD
jgi:acyl-CoA oxidase